MNSLINLSRSFTRLIVNRNISSTPLVSLKHIDVRVSGKESTIVGVNSPSPRETHLLKMEPHPKPACSLCLTNLDVKHTDVLILSQFLRSDGCVLPRRITGLCKRQQKRISILVAMSQKSGLMPNINPSYSKKDPKLRYGWKKYNKYFDESTIKLKYY